MQTVWSRISASTSCHGIPHLAAANTKLSKLFWLLIMVSCFGAIIYYEVTLVQSFLSNPTATIITEIRQNSLEFPNVTVCNLGGFSTTNYMAVWNKVQPALQRALGITSDPIQFLGFASKVIGANSDAINFEADPATLSVLEGQYHLLFNSSYFPYPMPASALLATVPHLDIQQFFSDVSFNCLQIFAGCWAAIPGFYCCDPRYTVPVMSPLGNCYQVQIPTLKTTADGNPLQSQAGSGWGFKMVLFTNQDDTPLLAKFYQEEGFLINFGESKTWYDRSVVTLIPGYNALISLHASKYLFDPSVEPCSASAPRLSYADQRVSSIPMCQQECSMVAMEYFCNCYVIFPNAKIPSQKVCSPVQLFQCYIWNNLAANITFTSMVENCQETKCVKMCESWSYQPSVMYSGIIPVNTTGVPKGAKTTKVTIYYNELMFTQVEVAPLMILSNFIAAFGGNLGLFAGISIVTIIHMFTSVIDVCVARFTRPTQVYEKTTVSVYNIRPVYIP